MAEEPTAARSALAIDGTRVSGADVRAQNVAACSAVANVVRTSLGPIGLDKMLVDEIGDVTITNDGATILRLLEVQHPAAKVMVDLAQLQDKEVGDGTTSVVIVAAELLKRAQDLIRSGVHPTNVIAGYRLAGKEACKYINDTLATRSESLSRAQLIAAAKTSISSKILGSESDFFASLCVDAMQRVKSGDAAKPKYPLKAINVLKQHGASARESVLVEGFALNCTIASQAMPKVIKNAKLACLDMNLNKAKAPHGVSIQILDPKELEKIRAREADITKEHIQMILATGANVVLTSKGIDDLALKYFVEAGAMAVRRVKKSDLRRIAKATGATVLVSLGTLEGSEAFDASNLGQAAIVEQVRVADDELIRITGTKNACSASIILRGANSVMLEEMDRSVHDCLCVVKRALESSSLVAGGGAVEGALSIFLENYANTLSTREQLAIAAYADALLVIPKQLAVNAALDATDLVAKLRAHHHTAQSDASMKALSQCGLDLHNGKIRNNLEAGVLEPAVSKVKMLQFATEAAITVLRISDLIQLNPRKRPAGPGEEDDDDMCD